MPDEIGGFKRAIVGLFTGLIVSTFLNASLSSSFDGEGSNYVPFVTFFQL